MPWGIFEGKNIWDRLNEEWGDVIGAAEAETPVLELTEDELQNGWTPETLAAYRAERSAAQTIEIDPNSTQRRLNARPSVQNNKYSPFRWRS